MENKLSFNKRILLVKKEVFEALQESKELDNIKGTDKTGFYSLSTIEKHLFPALDKYDIDLDLEIFSDKVIGHWYDCLEDKQRDIEIDFHRIENVGRLQLMANEVQSEGAVKSYTRRYSLTAILNLPSTDLIDPPQQQQQKPQQTQQTQQTQQKQQTQPAKPPIVNQGQLKRYYAIGKNKGLDMKYVDELVKVAFNIPSKNNWLISDYNKFTKFMNDNTGDTIIVKLKEKITKAGRAVPAIPEE